VTCHPVIVEAAIKRNSQPKSHPPIKKQGGRGRKERGAHIVTLFFDIEAGGGYIYATL